MATAGSPFVMQFAAAIPGPRDAGTLVIENGLRKIEADETTAVFPGDIVRVHRDD